MITEKQSIESYQAKLLREERVKRAYDFLTLFPAFSGHHPLKVGIHEDVLAIKNELGLSMSNTDIRAAITLYTNKPFYNFEDGTKRKDLRFDDCGVVGET